MPAPDPMLAVAGGEWPAGNGWLMQPKWDGFRLLIQINSRGEVRAWSRHGTNLTDCVGDLLDPISSLLPGTVLDGELVALAERDGRITQDFATVGRAALHGDRQACRRLHYVAFDLLQLEGTTTSSLPLAERVALLADALPSDRRLRPAGTWPADPTTHRQLVTLGFEGSVLKRARSTYRAGRHDTWRKHKARHRQPATIIDVGVSRDDRPYALCELPDGRRVTAIALAHSIRPGRRAEIVYSRIDANGDLREARLASPTAPSQRE